MTGHASNRSSTCDVDSKHSGGMRPNAIMADPKMADKEMSLVFSIAATDCSRSSGVADPNATNVTAATVSGISNCLMNTSIVGTKWLSVMQKIK